jgi:hypothetical protein
MDKYGYNVCMLYLEDAFLYERHPGVSRNHAYSKEFMREIQDLCASQKMELIPVIPSLGHCAYITSKPGYERYDEGRGTEKLCSTVSPSFPETYELLEELYEDWCSHIPGEYLHVGLDESPAMGQYFIRQNGLAKFDAEDMFAAHCNKLNGILKKLGRKMLMWGDMFYHFPDAAKKLDKDIIVVDWYYYSFPKTPKVEVFNFSEVDSVKNLKENNLETWGCPSIWPNYPFSDIQDRFENLRSWLRYGKPRKLDGIVNTDWENSLGFMNISTLLFSAFGKLLLEHDVEKISEPELKKALAELLEISPESSTLSDMLALKEFSLTGHANRKVIQQPPLSMISTEAERKAEYERKSKALEKMFSDLNDEIKQAARPQTQETLKAIELCYRQMLLYWKTGQVFSEFYETQSSSEELSKLADELDLFADDYFSFWEKARFPDELIKSRDWAKSTASTILEWLDKPLNKSSHPIFAESRLEMEVECRHPALPVLKAECFFKDGSNTTGGVTMINFESAYAVQNKIWRQYPVIPLEQGSLPEKIVFTVSHYGQIYLNKVKVLLNGKEYFYQAGETKGSFAKIENRQAVIGPVCANREDPTIRPEADQIVFIPA